MFFFFFFQAEDGIRDRDVTGVQTCALPICPWKAGRPAWWIVREETAMTGELGSGPGDAGRDAGPVRVETVVIGAGQAGLATGYHLAHRGRDFVILDAYQRVGDNWRCHWDSLRLYSPARIASLPGMRSQRRRCRIRPRTTWPISSRRTPPGSNCRFAPVCACAGWPTRTGSTS